MSTEEATPSPETMHDLVRFLAFPKLRLPRTARELFALLAQYDPQRGLGDLLKRVDFDGVGPVEIYRLVHGRPPDSPSEAMRPRDYNAIGKMSEALVSPEFRESLMHHFLRAFPEKRRDVFVHLPKCAGTDLTMNLAPRRLSFPTMLSTIVTEEEFLAYLGGLCRLVDRFDDIFVHGHIRLQDYVRHVGVQPGDRIFTVLRDPIDMLISTVSYALGQLLHDVEARNPETQERLGYLGLSRVPREFSPELAKELAVRAMFDERIAPPNPMCNHLGAWPNGTYRSAMTNIVMQDVEVTTLPRYSSWLAERWQIKPETRHNNSARLLSIREVHQFLRDRASQQVIEDQKLYDVVSWCLAKKGASSIKGLEIMEMVGARLLDDFSEHVRQEAMTGAGASWLDPPPFIAAEGQRAIQCFAIPLPSADNALRETVVQTIFFEAGGNSDAFRRDGWSKPEQRWTWTADPSCTLEFPRPAAQGDHVLRIQVRPFIVPERVQYQRVELAINDTMVATGIVREVSILECEVPWELLAPHETITLTFSLPKAARPTEVSGHPNDARLLGLAFEWLKLVKLGSPEVAAPAGSGAAQEEPDALSASEVEAVSAFASAKAAAYSDSLATAN